MNIWFKDKKFWTTWILHIILSFVLGWFFIVPIFKITFENGGYPIAQPTLLGLLLVYLVWIWLFQILTLLLVPRARQSIRWLIIAGAYLQLSFPITAAVVITQKMQIKSNVLRAGIIGLLAILCWIILFELTRVYAMVLVNALIPPL